MSKVSGRGSRGRGQLWRRPCNPGTSPSGLTVQEVSEVGGLHYGVLCS